MNKGKRRSKIGLVIILAVLVYFTWTVISQQKALSRVNGQIDDIKSKISQENKNYKDLKEQIKDVLSDSNIEKVARERLGMVKQGEKVFVDINK